MKHPHLVNTYVDDRGLVVGYLYMFEPYLQVIQRMTLESNPRASREVNPIVETRIRNRLDRRIERRKEVARISREK